MSASTASQAVDFSLAQGAAANAGHIEVVFFGGEPLLRFDLLCKICDWFCERSRACRVSFKLSTNGTMLDDRVMKALSERRVFVSLSLDGPPDIHDAQRPHVAGHGSSARIEEAIPCLLRWNPCSAVNCVITPKTASDVDRSVRWIVERGFAYVATTLDYSAEWSRRDLNNLEKAYHRLARWYEQQTLAGEKIYLSCFDERIRTWARGAPTPAERCGIGHRQFSIAPSGRLYPCVQFVREDLGDEFVIGDVWSGFNHSRRGELAGCAEGAKPECHGCAILDRCASWCACVNWQSTGKLGVASPIVCEHERLLMPIADRLGNRLWKRRSQVFIHRHYNDAFPILDFVERMTLTSTADSGEEL